MKLSKRKILSNYIKSDYRRLDRGEAGIFYIICFALVGRKPTFSYLFWLRCCHFHFLFIISRVMLMRYSRKFGLHIDYHVELGYGCFLEHEIGIIVNKTSKIGDNVTLSQFSTIGANDGQAATLGDNVYVGPSVCIVEDVHIGDNVTIGAGSVVTHDIPSNATAAGVPAKILNFDNPGRYIQFRSHYKGTGIDEIIN